MKKVVLLIVVLIVIGLAFPIANLVFEPSNDGLLTGLRPDDADFAAPAAVLEKKCVGCHVPQADLPFYAGFPVASSVIGGDIEDGIRFFDMKRAFENAGAPIPEVTLAKLELVVGNGTMPLGRYKALHWNAGLGADEQKVLVDWIHAVRRAEYSTGVAAPVFATEIVQPLATPENLNADLVALGDRLFHDPQLSGDDTVSCASCHDLALGGTDQLQFSKGIDGQVGGINAPTVYNSSFMVRQFWDGRAADLVEQAGGPVTNPIEMAAAWPDVLAKLEKDPKYVRAFGLHFPDGITAHNVQEAIAHFESSLVTTGSAFDAYLMGDDSAISAEVKDGYGLFVEHGCASCHVGPALGGQSFEYMGLRADYLADRGNVGEADQGLFNFSGEEGDRHKFKVPTLRNLTVTFPYFHDGSTSDLKEAVETMVKYQTEASLSEAEVGKLVAFLESLTGEYGGKKL